MPIKRLKYVSRFAEPMTADQIQALASDAARANEAQDITGVLMTSGGLFFQVIEGPPEVVDPLYVKILSDPRHTDVVLLGVELVEERLFGSWGMKAMNLDTAAWRRAEPLRDLLVALLAQRDAMETMSAYLQRAVWEEVQER